MRRSVFKVDASAMKRIVNGVAAGKRIYEEPFKGERGKAAVQILRFGPGGIKEQFDTSTEMRRNSVYPWKVTEPFGNRPGNSTPMAGGSYEQSWLGFGPGALTPKETSNSIEVGVDTSVHPQAKIHQGNRPTVKIKAKTPWPGRKGDWLMRGVIGMTYGLWLTIEKVRVTGMLIERRRVSISNEVLSGIRKSLRAEFGKAVFRVKIAARESKA